MRKIVTITLIVAFMAYSLCGFFGYLTFSNNVNELVSDENGGIIILGDYNNSVPILISFVLISLTNIICVPMAVKPTKDCLLEIVFPNRK